MDVMSFDDGGDIVCLAVTKLEHRVDKVEFSCAYKVNSSYVTIKCLDGLIEPTTIFELITKFTKLKSLHLRGFDFMNLQILMNLPPNIQQLKLRAENLRTFPKQINP